MYFYMKDDHFVMQTDNSELPISANEDFGFRPYELMVASIAGCSAIVLKKIVHKMRMDITNIKVKADVQREETHAQKILAIHLHFIVEGNNLSDEKIKKALHLTHKHCSMVQSVQNSINVTESVEVQSS